MTETLTANLIILTSSHLSDHTVSIEKEQSDHKSQRLMLRWVLRTNNQSWTLQQALKILFHKVKRLHHKEQELEREVQQRILELIEKVTACQKWQRLLLLQLIKPETVSLEHKAPVVISKEASLSNKEVLLANQVLKALLATWSNLTLK